RSHTFSPNDTAPTGIYPLSLHDALPIWSTSSPAARRVKVTASTCRASASSSRTRQAILRVRTRVLPDPAGARIASGKCVSVTARSEEHTSELQSRFDLVCRLLLEKKNNK